MKLMRILVLLNSLLCCATQTSGITIESTPAIDLNGFIHTELEETVSLTCRSHDSEPESDLVWLRNDALVSLNDGNRKGQSRVCISPVILADREAVFTCHTQSNSTERVSVQLNVTYPPPLSGSESVSVEEEETMVLLCDIDAHPAVSSVTWTFNGTELDLKAGRFVLTNDGLTSRVSTEKIQRSLHEGSYSCIADSPMYGPQTQVFTVHVSDKTVKFPLWPMVAGIVVVCLTAALAVASRWRKIIKCCK